MIATVQDEFITPADALTLMGAIPVEFINHRSAQGLNAQFPSMRQRAPHGIHTAHARRVAQLTGLPIADLDDPHGSALVAYRPGENWKDVHTALDLASDYGRSVFHKYNGQRQRYAEVLVWLTAPPDGGGSLDFKGQRVDARVGRAVWWMAADKNNVQIPDSKYNVQPVTSDDPWCWVLQTRFRRDVTGIEKPTPEVMTRETAKVIAHVIESRKEKPAKP